MVSVLQRLWQAQQKGESLSDRQLLQQVEGLEQSKWDSYNSILLDASVIRRTDRGDYLLARDMGRFTLDQLNQLLPWPLPEGTAPDAVSGWQSELNKRLHTLNEVRHQQLNLTLEELFSE